VFISAEDEYELKFGKYLRFSDTRYSSEYNDIRADMIPNLNLLNGIPSANNFDPFVPARYDAWLKAVNEIEADRRDPYLATMGVKAVIQLREGFSIDVRILELEPAQLIESRPCIQSVQNETQALEATLKKILAGNSDEQCIIIEASKAPLDEEYAEETLVTEVETGGYWIKFRIDSDQPAWMRIGMTWYPGWQAEVDGDDTPVYHADYVFSAFRVPAGSHEVMFRYRPVSIIAGAAISFAGVFAAMLVGWFCNRTRNREAASSNNNTEA